MWAVDTHFKTDSTTSEILGTLCSQRAHVFYLIVQNLVGPVSLGKDPAIVLCRNTHARKYALLQGRICSDVNSRLDSRRGYLLCLKLGPKHLLSTATRSSASCSPAAHPSYMNIFYLSVRPSSTPLHLTPTSSSPIAVWMTRTLLCSSTIATSKLQNPRSASLRSRRREPTGTGSLLSIVMLRIVVDEA